MAKKKKLKSMAENNAEAFASNTSFLDMNKPQLNGIACPNCGEELYDSQPMVTLTSHPAQKNVHCGKCGYRGYRFV